MKGAREYARLGLNGQYGRLYIKTGSHARGYTMRVWVLPEGEQVGRRRIQQVPDAVEVYGVVSSSPGWPDEYGWLHRGPWEDDFRALVDSRHKLLEEQAALRAAEERAGAEAKRAREAAVLASYAAQRIGGAS